MQSGVVYDVLDRRVRTLLDGPQRREEECSDELVAQ
jgi:hypothetical protein